MESGIPHRIQTPLGDLVFNDWDAYDSVGTLMITKITGFDPETRSPVDNRSGVDGAIVHPSLDGPRIYTIEGLILAPDNDARTDLMDKVRSYVRAIKGTDGRHIYTPSGKSERFVAVRRHDKTEIGDAPTSSSAIAASSVIKTFTIVLIAGDPVSYTYTETDTIFTPGQTQSVMNNGNVDSFPVVRVYGPSTVGWDIVNNTTGKTVVALGGAIASGHLVEVIMDEETMYVDRDGALYLGYMDFVNSDFWALVPGTNSITFNSDGGSALLLSNDGWA